MGLADLFFAGIWIGGFLEMWSEARDEEENVLVRFGICIAWPLFFGGSLVHWAGENIDGDKKNDK